MVGTCEQPDADDRTIAVRRGSRFVIRGCDQGAVDGPRRGPVSRPQPGRPEVSARTGPSKVTASQWPRSTRTIRAGISPSTWCDANVNGPSPRDGGWAFCSGGDQRIRGRDGYR
ncbi:hypothetical protein Arub01_46920 [Actinomadura rubrobrunea]|uniref:Uncharacterized protein n=1 Tax=Actinomadura rubrobrunea TaxID=115335 RepID=A0A9W6Q0Q5_9ACTN|nr:hypothetical protein [Actinomadura rubrobrunea]GLW66448.1 hypothetical protein Arub01_46920 [Actinomadura rubrobrunea]